MSPSEQLEQLIPAEDASVTEGFNTAAHAEPEAEPAADLSTQATNQQTNGKEMLEPVEGHDQSQGDLGSSLVPTAEQSVNSDEPEAVIQRQYRSRDNDYVYAVGVLKPEFPNQGLLEAFYSAAQNLNVSEYDYYAVLNHVEGNNHRPYFYIAEQINWVLSIHDKETYQLQPRSKAELMCFIQALKPPENSLLSVLSTVVGVVDDSASATGSDNEETGLTKVVCNHLFSQTLDSLHDMLQKQTGVNTSVIQDVLKGLEYQPNQGRSDFSRAKNYLAYRYPELYLTTHTMQKDEGTSVAGYFLQDVNASYSDLASPHVIVDLTFSYKNKGRDNGHPPEVYFHCSVDVTHQFPFVNTPLQKYMPFTLMAG
ncbi:hypothetical protein F0223_17470 [Vibrio coralliilyticus]|uniref:cyanobactin maturation protease PatG family protein n=1 Tax=Vibrio TaxID=662 RepID=UPI00068E37D2|nr:MULTISPECIES: hypothetical protein [Vibrio]NOI20016.1 hypothetical protein [Vibrio coralliilyticus]